MNLFFFFSSRRRHTRSKRDWSSDVCSSDLQLRDSLQAPRRGSTAARLLAQPLHLAIGEQLDLVGKHPAVAQVLRVDGVDRSEERRVGKECRYRWAPYH